MGIFTRHSEPNSGVTSSPKPNRKQRRQAKKQRGKKRKALKDLAKATRDAAIAYANFAPVYHRNKRAFDHASLQYQLGHIDPDSTPDDNEQEVHNAS